MAEQKFLTNLNLNGNQLVKTAVENLASDPDSGLIAGRIIFNTTQSVFKIYDGTKWVTLGSSADIDKVKVKNEDGSITVGTPTAQGTVISVAISDDSDNAITLEEDGLKVKDITADNETIVIDTTGGKKEIQIKESYTQGLIGDNTSTKDSDTIEGAKRYADFVQETLEGTVQDTKDSATIEGAKRYADNIKSEVIGTAQDTASDDTIKGAKKYTDEAEEALIGTVSDTKDDDTIKGAKKYTDAAIEDLTSAKQLQAGQYVKAVQQTNGEVVAEFGQVAAAEVSVADADEYFDSDNVEGVLKELYEQAGAGSAVTIQEITSAQSLASDVLKAYKFYQGDPTSESNLIGTINIPKDLVVTSGSVVTGTWNGSVFTEDPTQPGSGPDKALKLTIANQQAPVYINVVDLVKDHTAGDGIDISANNVISVVIDSTSEDFLSVGAQGVKLAGVQSAIGAAKSEVIGQNGDESSADTIYGAKKYTDEAKEDLIGESTDASSAQTICGAKKYADELGEDLIGESTDASSADTIYGAKKKAEEEAAAVLGTAQDVATDNTVYGAKKYTDARETAIKAALPHYYSTTITPTSGTHSTTIAAATHECGLHPMVQTYMGVDLVITQVAVSATGAVTVSWNGDIDSLTIVIIGKVEE